jgi:threonine synthase
MSIWRWHEWLDAPPAACRLTLGEGNTPLLASRRVGPRAGLSRLLFKLETTNPSGSYKDRFAAAAISHMSAVGAGLCVATSSGNTGASLAAYCAAAGIRCEIAIVETAPQDKLRQMLAYGARLLRIRGFGLDPQITQSVLDHIQLCGSQSGAAIQVSAFRYSPQGMAGVQSLAYELAEQTAEVIDHVFCPAGGGGLAIAVARGFSRLHDLGKLARVPAVECVQPEGNDTIAGALRQGRERARAVQCRTAISGLQVASVIDGDETIAAVRATGGSGHLVSDPEVWDVQQRLAGEEGIFCEPAAAVAVAGALRAVREGRVAQDATIVCLVTGSGFKDRGAPLVDLDTFRRPFADAGGSR